MDVSITPELAAQLTSGRFKNASEVVRAAWRFLKDAEAHRSKARLPKPADDAAAHGR